MENLRKPVVSALFGTISLALTNYFLTYLKVLQVPMIISWALVLLIAFFVILLSYVYGKTIRSIPFIRVPFYHQSKFEGYWLENCEVEDRPFAFATLYYSHKDSAWIYRGTAFNSKLEPAARWKTISVSFDSQANKWLFQGKCQLISKQGDGFIRAGLADDVSVVLTLPDTQTDSIPDCIATDMATMDGKPHSFRVLLYKFRPELMVGSDRNTPEVVPRDIENVSFAMAAKIIREHRSHGRLPNISWKTKP